MGPTHFWENVKICRDELRSLAVAGGIRAKIGDRWLPVAPLRSALMEALAPTEQAQSLCFGYR